MSSADQYHDCSVTNAIAANGDPIPSNGMPETSGSSLRSFRSLTLQSLSSARDLPGFRFHPTEDELVGFYLRHLLEGRRNIPSYLIRTIDLYNYDPWELISLPAAEEEAASGGSRSRWGVGTGGGNGLPEADCSARYWYFFVPYASRLQHQSGGGGEGQSQSRQRKRKSAAALGRRPTRLTKSGFWKATGTDTAVETTAFRALRKTLVFYLGRAPKGRRTSWVMNEYRANTAGGTSAPNYGIDPSRAGSTLCRLRRKSAPESAADGIAIGKAMVMTTVNNGSVGPLPYVELSAAVNMERGRRPVYHPQLQGNQLI